MIQEIIAYFIITLAVLKMVYSVYIFLFSKKSSCACASGACSSSELSNIKHQVQINTQYWKKTA